MKKNLLALFICFVLLFSCVACQPSTDPAVAPPDDGTPFQATGATGKLLAYEGTQNDEQQTCTYMTNDDDRYYIYYFELGTISKVPLHTSIAMQYEFDTDVSFTFGKLSQKTLENNAARSTEVIATVSQTIGLDVGIEHEISAGIGIELDKVKASVESSLKESFNFKSELTNTWARTVTDSVSTTSGYLTQFSQEYTETIHFSEAAGFKKGYYYRMAFYDSLKAYGVLVYDIANDRYSATTDYLFGDKTPVRVWETSDSPAFSYEPHKDLVFDVEQAIAYAKAHSKPEPTVAPASGTYYLPTTPLSCGLDNGYNYDKPSRDANNKHFSHDFDFGNFVLTGCTKDITEKDSYFTLPNNSVDISFRLEYDTDHLPLQDTMTSRSVSNDNKQSGFYKLPWNVGERNVGRGMIVVLVEYDDGTPSQKICTVNALGGKRPGELVSIVTVDKPCTVTIAICYELVQWAPGFLGISDDYWTNWRINQTFRFR